MSERPFRRGRQWQERLQSVQHLLKQARYAWKDAELPFQPHHRLISGGAKSLVKRKMKDQMVAYDPDVFRDEERLCVGGEERHPLPRAALFLVLGVYPRPVFAGLGHAAERLRVMHEGPVECLGQRRIRDVCGERAAQRVVGERAGSEEMRHGWLCIPS